ncbi:MAG: hypothetical protein RI907_3615 [Pseudomonadota bacterium]|jgi:uncharacterized protein (TIGR03790 family)
MNDKRAYSTAWPSRAWVVAACLGVCVALGAGTSWAQPGGSGPEVAASAASTAAAAQVRKWMTVPRVLGRLSAKDLGVVINTDDPYSVQVGEYYARARNIPDDRVLRLSLPIKSALTASEFETFSKRIDQFYGDRVQGLALTWRQPYGVECNAITGALALGFDPKLCSNPCSPSRTSSYFASPSQAPWKDFHMRLSMLIAAKDVEGAKALIDRGVKADGSLGLRGAPVAHVHYVTTSDEVRSQRQLLFPPAGGVGRAGLAVHLDQTEALRNADRVLMYLTGRANVDALDTNTFVPGALGDHLTSFGGVLDKPHGQMTALSWIDAGVTATYGTTSEPCAHLTKFPHPQALLLFYVQGATALEAYWKSVAWPQQGLFVGEPLAAPFSRLPQ